MVGKSAGVGKLVERWSEVEEAVVRHRTIVAIKAVCVPMGAVKVKLLCGSQLHVPASLFRQWIVRAEGRCGAVAGKTGSRESMNAGVNGKFVNYRVRRGPFVPIPIAAIKWDAVRVVNSKVVSVVVMCSSACAAWVLRERA